MRSMDIGGYRHNYEGFYEKSTYQISINKGENDYNSMCSCKLTVTILCGR